MSYKTVFVGPIFDAYVRERAPAESLMRYALDLAAAQGAHLAIGVGSVRLSAPSAAVIRDARGLIASANEERRRHAETFANDMLTRARAAGVTADMELIHDDYSAVSRRFLRLARVADVAVMQPSDETLSLTQGLAEDILFGAGRPLIMVPPGHAAGAAFKKILVAWDGSAKAARAIGDALPLLARASEVEVVSISGDPDATKSIDGAEIAPHLARHCHSVRVTALPAGEGDIFAVLRDHANFVRADLLVMGAYAHTKFRQLILGGVTSQMIHSPPVPTLMSY